MVSNTSVRNGVGCGLFALCWVVGSAARAQADAAPVAPPSAAASDAVADGGALRIAGYNKTLFITTSTMDPDNQPYTQALNRLRLKLDYTKSEHFTAHVEEDVTLQAGNYLNTTAFQFEKNAPTRQYWRDGSTFGNESSYYGTQKLFRAYAKFSAGAADLTVGRQRIALGTGRMWSTLDMLNPINPLQVERDEYVGVDAALLQYRVGALSRASLIYAPDPARSSDRWVGQYRTNIKGSDLAFTYGKYWGDHFAGVDLATQIGDAGVRAEWTYTSPASGSRYQKMLLGVDYEFANTLTFSGEVYYSGQDRQERLAQFVQNPLLAQVVPFDSRYAGLSVTYEFTPLFKTANYFLYNLRDHSRFISPTLTYSPADNVLIAGGVQFFSGGEGSDFGRGKNLRYIQLQWFF